MHEASSCRIVVNGPVCERVAALIRSKAKVSQCASGYDAEVCCGAGQMAGTNFVRQIHPVLRFIVSIILFLLRRLGLRDNICTPAMSGARLADVAATGGVSMTDSGAPLINLTWSSYGPSGWHLSVVIMH